MADSRTSDIIARMLPKNTEAVCCALERINTKTQKRFVNFVVTRISTNEFENSFL